MKRIKLINTAITAQYGTLSPGDIINTSDEFAAHLVDQCSAAVYLELPDLVVDEPAATTTAARRRAAKEKQAAESTETESATVEQTTEQTESSAVEQTTEQTETPAE